MNENYTSAIKLGEKFGLYLKVVTSVKTFDNFNSFFNIFDQQDEPCRRILVLTPYKELEEIYDDKPDEPIVENIIVDGNLWIKEFPLTTNPKNIDLESVVVSTALVRKMLLNS